MKHCLDIREAKCSRLFGRQLLRFPVGWLYRWPGVPDLYSVEYGFPHAPGCDILRTLYGPSRYIYVLRRDLGGFLRAHRFTENRGACRVG